MHENIHVSLLKDCAITAEYPLDEVEIRKEAAMLLGLNYTLLIAGKKVEKLPEVRQNNASIIVDLPDVKALDEYWATIDILKRSLSEV